jgi:peptidoglycan/LPS O-acetylase OafA/YrhL
MTQMALDTQIRSDGAPTLALPDTSPPRITSLDGVRGLAALAVVIDHCMIANQNISQYTEIPTVPSHHSTAWWIVDSPLHIFWPGTEAVYLFFVLSGLVLSLPWLGARRPSWLGYYPSRLVRLYIPVAAAVALAVANFNLVRRHFVPGGSLWLSSNALHLTWSKVLHDAYLLHGTDNLNGPLWSLEWEVVFSLCLPLFIVGGMFGRRLWPLKFLALLVAMVLGFRYNNPSLGYMPIFGIGVLMAFHWNQLNALAGRLTRKSERPLGVLAAVGALLILASALLDSIGPMKGLSLLDPDSSKMLSVLGGATMIFLAVHWSTARRFCDRPAVQWVGKRSFSLYLVHAPIVVSLAFLLGGKPNTAVLLAVALPASLLVADVFHRLVERPAIELSHVLRRLGRTRQPTIIGHPGR